MTFVKFIISTRQFTLPDDKMIPAELFAQLPEPADYFPISKGVYSTRAGLSKLDENLFQIDRQFSLYRDNKIAARNRAKQDYVCLDLASQSQLDTVSHFILQQLCQAYPGFFSLKDERLYCRLSHDVLRLDAENLFDLLALQIQEDVCVMQMDASATRLIAAHLCAPNHWSAKDKLGMDMGGLHQFVPGFSDENKKPNQLLAGLHNNAQSYVRFAWGLSSHAILDQHPDRITPPPTDDELWLRIERQVLTPLANTDLMLFTIRTYFRDCAKLTKQQKAELVSAINSMSEATLEYKKINKVDALKRLK